MEKNNTMMDINVKDPAEAGRATDTVLGHLSLGELVIPRAFLDDPDFLEMLSLYFNEQGIDLAEFTVGDPANKINPETGYPEFFKFKRFFRKVAPFAGLALNFVPGLQGIGAALGGSLLGAGAAGSATLGNALIGGGLGALSGGGVKSAALGALGGAISPNIGSLPGTNNLPWLPAGLQNGAVESGSGIMGAIGRTTGLNASNLPSIGGLAGGSSGGGGSSFGLGNALAGAFGGIQQDSAMKKARRDLLDANADQMAELDSFDPSGLMEDPGYEFQRQQGEEALNRSLGARGNLFSGAALKAASQYNQDYASNAFKDYYNRWRDRTNARTGVIGARGDINASARLGRSNNINQAFANAFGGY